MRLPSGNDIPKEGMCHGSDKIQTRDLVLVPVNQLSVQKHGLDCRMMDRSIRSAVEENANLVWEIAVPLTKG